MGDGQLIEVPSSPIKVMVVPALTFAVGVAMLGVTVGLLASGNRPQIPFGPLWLMGYGLYRGLPAYRHRHATVLSVDEKGATTPSGRLQPWAGTAAVWVGSRANRWLPEALRTTYLHFFSRAGVEFSRRAATGVATSSTVPVPTAWTPGQVATALRRVTDVPVQTAEDVSLRTLRRNLVGSDA